ncbi:MAG: AAA family ATPase [Paraglaciecola sp.]|uniref:AAA family ATPase n=1 Tax=Paraglaciecola sp. TaxID=1920173 RepID=UPI00329769B6
MKKILIFGNSGSGKSTLAKYLSLKEDLAHLDLDTIAWLPTNPPRRKQFTDSKNEIDRFINTHSRWVIEGCYTDLLELALDSVTDIIFMNLSIQDCIANAKQRPWEAHKYTSKEAQDANLAMLIEWISQYTKRNDTFSHLAHNSFFQNYSGVKHMIMSNSDSSKLFQ